MKTLFLISISLILAIGGIACSSNSRDEGVSSRYNSSLRTRNPILTPEQLKTLENYHHLQRGFFLDHQRRRLEVRDVLDVQTDEQLQSIENLRWLHQYSEGQRLEREARKRLGTGVF